MKKFSMPREVKIIIDTLNKNGFEAYLVGGCVRDVIMGISPKDWDITTSARPEEVKGLFKHTFDSGIKHGTITVLFGKTGYEVTTYRTDGEYKDCRRPESVEFTKNLPEDLKRRDFTMNAIAYHPENGFIDICGGMEDIRNKTIRGVGEPDKRFSEDALRMLRGVRFACQLGFEMEEKTKAAAAEKAYLIEKISAERIHDELTKLLLSEYVEHTALLWETGLLSYMIPEISEAVRENGESIIKELKASRKDASVRYPIFLQYADKGCVKGILKRLVFDTKTLRETDAVTREIDSELEDSEYFIRKKAFAMGEREFCLLLEVKKAKGDALAKKTEEAFEKIKERGDAITLKELCINGNDLAALGIKNGREMGAMLLSLLDIVHRTPKTNKKAELLERARKMIADDAEKQGDDVIGN